MGYCIVHPSVLLTKKKALDKVLLFIVSPGCQHTYQLINLATTIPRKKPGKVKGTDHWSLVIDA